MLHRGYFLRELLLYFQIINFDFNLLILMCSEFALVLIRKFAFQPQMIQINVFIRLFMYSCHFRLEILNETH